MPGWCGPPQPRWKRRAPAVGASAAPPGAASTTSAGDADLVLGQLTAQSPPAPNTNKSPKTIKKENLNANL
jgi:hypothetical protein